MAITRGDVKNLTRSLLREKTTDSYDDTDLNRFFIATLRYWSLETLWPQSIWISDPATGNGTVIGVQEYALPEDINQVFRVYVRGNRLKPVTIPLMEGDVRQIFDPTWKILPNVTLPDLTTQLTSSGGIPITAGAPPNLGSIPPSMGYYVRGGFIGLVPPPAAAYIFKIEGAAVPVEPGDDNALLVFPPQFLQGLAAGTAKLLSISDDKQQTAQAMAALESEGLAMCKFWRRSFQGDLQIFAQPLGYRSHWGRRNLAGIRRLQ